MMRHSPLLPESLRLCVSVGNLYSVSLSISVHLWFLSAWNPCDLPLKGAGGRGLSSWDGSGGKGERVIAPPPTG